MSYERLGLAASLPGHHTRWIGLGGKMNGPTKYLVTGLAASAATLAGERLWDRWRHPEVTPTAPTPPHEANEPEAATEDAGTLEELIDEKAETAGRKLRPWWKSVEALASIGGCVGLLVGVWTNVDVPQTTMRAAETIADFFQDDPVDYCIQQQRGSCPVPEDPDEVEQEAAKQAAERARIDEGPPTTYCPITVEGQTILVACLATSGASRSTLNDE